MSPIYISAKSQNADNASASVNTVLPRPSMEQMEKALADLEIKIERQNLTDSQYEELCY